MKKIIFNEKNQGHILIVDKQEEMPKKCDRCFINLTIPFYHNSGKFYCRECVYRYDRDISIQEIINLKESTSKEFNKIVGVEIGK